MGSSQHNQLEPKNFSRIHEAELNERIYLLHNVIRCYENIISHIFSINQNDKFDGLIQPALWMCAPLFSLVVLCANEMKKQKTEIFYIYGIYCQPNTPASHYVFVPFIIPFLSVRFRYV